ncbi:MAG: hypothetical protein LYZ70_07910, partial [Nitrososphaerales archaeon]|nr:hypothetical protein [Nitrososphaerales archaeon]
MSVISVKVPEDVKEKMKKTKDRVDWPEEIRNFVARRVEELEKTRRLEEVKGLLADLPIQPRGSISRLVSEDRDSHCCFFPLGIHPRARRI